MIQPPISECGKICMKILLCPPAFFTYIIGWIIITVTYTIGACCCPLIGPDFFALMLKARLTSKSGPEAVQQVRKDVANSMCLMKCLISLAIFTMRDLIRPLPALCEW